MIADKALAVGPAKIDIAYERFGDINNPPVLLIMGVGAQMLNWPDGFVEALVAEGLQVIRFDNRDAGLSTHFPDAPIPNIPAALAGDKSTASYTLSDMAADSIGLLDALQIENAHLVGASMGGFIAQTVAIEFPQRLRSLTSMMSTTGNMLVGQPAPEVFGIMAGIPPSNREEVIEKAVEALRVVGSPGYPMDEAAVRKRTGIAYDRNFDPMGMARQAIASIVSGDRTSKLGSIRVPTLVIHGADDKMCHVSGGRATAAAIPEARLEIIPGMGHDLPEALWPQLCSLIAGHVKSVTN